MRTIVRQTGHRTTIEVKADKGEDLRGIAEALTSPASSKKRVSVIEAAHYAAVQAWLKTIPDNGGELDSALDAAILAALPHLDGFSFQDGVAAWMQACFGPEITGDKLERGDRLLEEVFELLQSGDYPHDRINALQAYVYGRPKGEPFQEVGGVLVTLAAYCIAHNVDMHVCGGMELARVWTKIEQIRAKQAAKPKGSALPIAQTSPADKMSQAAIDVLAERRRQIEVKGWTPEHDDEHRHGEILWEAWGALARLSGQALEQRTSGNLSHYRQILVEGTAMILAEIERLDRTASRDEA